MLGLILQPTPTNRARSASEGPTPHPPPFSTASASSLLPTPSGAGHSRPPLPPTDPPSSFIPPPSSFDLSPEDIELLESIDNPPSHLSPLDLARWLAQPHIHAALQQLQSLRALQHQRWREQATREAIDALRDITRQTEDPIERRRAATAILRALTRPSQSRGRKHAEGAPPRPTNPPPQRGGGQAQAQREPGGGASPNPDSARPDAEAEPREAPHPLTPTPPHPSTHPLPPSSRSTPDTLTTELLTRCRALDNPTPELLREHLLGALDIQVLRDPARSLDLCARLAASPLCDPALRATPPTIKPVSTATPNTTATRRLRWQTDAGTRTLTLRFRHDDGERRFQPLHWTLNDIAPDTS